MACKPRDSKEKLLTAKVLVKSVLQGLVIFAASFGTYYTVLLQNPANATIARTMRLAIIMLANLFLVQVNSSDSDFAIQSFFRLIKDKVMWVVMLGTVGGLLLIPYTPLCGFLKLAPLSAIQFLTVVGIAAISVLWYEFVKLFKRIFRSSKI